MAGAIGRRAEEVFRGLDESAARRRADRCSAGSSRPGSGGPDTRRRARLGELSTGMREVADEFVAARLLVADRDPATREPTVEVAHEALLTRWSRLVDWVDEDRRWLDQLQHLAAAARGVGRRPAASDGELYRGVAVGGRDRGARPRRVERRRTSSATSSRPAVTPGTPRSLGARRTARRLRTAAGRRAPWRWSSWRDRRRGRRRPARPGRRATLASRGAGRARPRPRRARRDRGPRRSRRVAPPDPARHGRAARRRGVPARRHPAHPLGPVRHVHRQTRRSTTPTACRATAAAPASSCPTARRRTSSTTRTAAALRARHRSRSATRSRRSAARPRASSLLAASADGGGSPSVRRADVGAGPTTVGVFDTRTGSLAFPPIAVDGAVWSAAFSPTQPTSRARRSARRRGCSSSTRAPARSWRRRPV